MNNKKLGFTLVELLAVIIILAAIMLIIIPLVTSSVKDGSDAAIAQNKESIEMASQNWASDNKNWLPGTGEEICISVSALIQEGYLDNNVSEEFINGGVLITNTNDVYYYTFQEEGCSEENSLYKNITLDYETNGGTSLKGSSSSIIPALPGNTINIGSYEAVKDGYEFVGWNTNKDAHTGFEEYTMPTKDVTLYAIFKKTVETKFEVQEYQNVVIASASSESETCVMYNNDTNCTITAPTLTSIAGTEVVGWNTDKDAKEAIVQSGEQFNVSESDTYYSIIDILDNEAPTCSITIVSGTKGNNSWYTSNVTIEMTSSDSGGSTLTNYGMTTSTTATYNSTSSVVHKSDGKSITYYGYVRDGVGNTNKCSITFKKDSTAPTITSLSNSSGGEQTSSSVVITAKASDATSGMNRISYRYSKTGTEYNDWSSSSSTSVKKTWTDEINKTVYVYAYDNAGNSTYKSAGKVYIVKDSDFQLYGSRTCNGTCQVPGTSYWNDRLWRFWWTGANTGINRDSFSLKYSTAYVTNYCTWDNSNLPTGSRTNCGYVKFNSDEIYFSRSYANASIVVTLCTNGGQCATKKVTF